MNTNAPGICSDVPQLRFLRRATAQALLALAAFTAQHAQAAVECAPFQWEQVRLDATSEKDRVAVASVVANHFDADTEALIRGITGSVGGDIDFLVRHSPNHHRGLAALVRLAAKDKSSQPKGVKIPVECYLLRALEFTPSDPEILKIYATHLARLNRNAEALATFEQAEKLVPDDPIVAYNIGLLLADKRDFEQARAYAKKAYAAGIQFPGLRDKLAKQGQWR